MPVKYLSALLLSSALFITSISAENKSVKVPGSDNQWPMSGGPDGSWKVKTDKEIPLKWSVRNDENIKWKTTLPEGGQSGIAVWGDKLFLTINKPLSTPPFNQSREQYESASAEYKKLFRETEDNLNGSDAEFQQLKEELQNSSVKWEQFLTGNKPFQKAPANRKNRVKTELLKSSQEGREWTKCSKKYTEYIYQKAPKVSSLNAKMVKAQKDMTSWGMEADIEVYCLNSESGKILWTKPVKGLMKSGYNYGFSDSTTPCPVTDGRNVWVINSSGGMACFTMDGSLVWERTWMPTGGRPFNKQFDSILFKDLILNVEPPVEGDETRVKDWNYLHAFDKKTGKRVWVTKQALTHYNTPILGETAEGKPAVLIGRGGPHGVPERPVGLSLISLDESNSGSEIWHWEPKDDNNISGWGALSTQHWDKEKASWFYAGDDHLTVDTKTGTLLSQHKLNLVDQYNFDSNSGEYKLTKDVELKKLQNQRHCNISDGDFVFYMVRFEPYIARHNVKTGRNEHLEVPREIAEDGQKIWKTVQKNDGLNSQGQMHSSDNRTRGDGFQKCFLGSPTMVNNYIFFTNALGIVYVIDANAEKFDQSALVSVNDLGKKGETWSVNSLTYANGKLFHRTMKEVICIGK